MAHSAAVIIARMPQGQSGTSWLVRLRKRNADAYSGPAFRRIEELHTLFLTVEGFKPLARDLQTETGSWWTVSLAHTGSVVFHFQLEFWALGRRGDLNLASVIQFRNAMLNGIVYQWLQQQMRDLGIESLGSNVEGYGQPSQFRGNNSRIRARGKAW